MVYVACKLTLPYHLRKSCYRNCLKFVFHKGYEKKLHCLIGIVICPYILTHCNPKIFLTQNHQDINLQNLKDHLHLYRIPCQFRMMFSTQCEVGQNQNSQLFEYLHQDFQKTLIHHQRFSNWIFRLTIFVTSS